MRLRMGGIDDAHNWHDFSNMRNHLSHDYPDAPEITAKNLNHAFELVPKLLETLGRLEKFTRDAQSTLGTVKQKTAILSRNFWISCKSILRTERATHSLVYVRIGSAKIAPQMVQKSKKEWQFFVLQCLSHLIHLCDI
jgi:hypothetical protein